VLSYRHAFHAGNHADVLKHLTLIALLRHFNQKETPYSYLDTHSGKAYYDLSGAMAQKNLEHESGVSKLWQQQWDDPILRTYGDLLSAANPHRLLRNYLGSPAIARELTRPQDKLILMELHSQEFPLLKKNFRGDPRVHLHQRDGFEGLPAMVPPDPRRGLALIDPAYEVKTDYERVVSCTDKVLRRWQTGAIAIWFPLLSATRDRGEWLKSRFRQSGFSKVLLVELKVEEQHPESGMHGSGMLIVNTPWQLDQVLASTLARVKDQLQPACADPVNVQWLTGEGE
jgi:23S rRNA (adenine2030-N6)-methyltransferase